MKENENWTLIHPSSELCGFGYVTSFIKDRFISCQMLGEGWQHLSGPELECFKDHGTINI